MTDHEINVAIGRKMQELRKKRGIKLKDAAPMYGMSYQQVQKYENGSNRIHAAKLVHIAAILKVDPSELLPEVF